MRWPSEAVTALWVNGKLSFTLNFAKHESIVVQGTLNEGKLAGELLETEIEYADRYIWS